MNLPFFMSEMPVITLSLLGLFIAAAIYLLKYKFKNSAVKKWIIFFALYWAGLAVACILFYNIYLSIGRTQINAKLAEMREQGIPLDKDAILPKMPEKDSDNGAVSYKAAFSLIDTDAEIFKCAAEYGYNFTKWPDEKQKTFQQVLNSQNIEKIFNLFRQGAEKPCAVYARDYQDFAALLLPELNPQRALFRLISLKISYDGLSGNPEAGYGLVCDGFKTVKQFESDPVLISQLVGMACATLNIDAMNSLISSYGISSHTAWQLVAGLDKLNFNAAMAHAIDGEIMLGRDIFEKIISRKKTLSECLGDSSSLIEKYGLWPFICQDYIWYLTYMAKNRALFSQPYWLEEKQIEELNNELNRNNFPIYYLVSAATAMTPDIRIKPARIESEIDAAKLTLALHIYKNQHGMFPDELKELAPDILKEIPVDPISGKPFEYQKTESSFTISSVWLKEKEQEKRNRNKPK